MKPRAAPAMPSARSLHEEFTDRPLIDQISRYAPILRRPIRQCNPLPQAGASRAAACTFGAGSDDAASAASHIKRGSNVNDATIVNIDISMKVIAPHPAVALASAPKFTSGTKNTMVKGSVFDQRPSSATARKALVLAMRWRGERRQTDRTHHAMTAIFPTGMRMLVQKMMHPSGQSPSSNSSRTPVKIV